MSAVTAAQVKELREATGAGMMDCKAALIEVGGDFEAAVSYLREKGLASAAKRAGRSANQGVIESYIHFNRTVGVLVELNCETDFVANTDEFQVLARDLALHIASPAAPRYVTRDDVPQGELDAERRIFEAQVKEMNKPADVVDKIVDNKLASYLQEVVLLDQPFVRDDSTTVQQLLDAVSAKVGEKVAVRRFARYKLGEDVE